MPATKERTYNDAEIAERLKQLSGWYYEDGWIRRVYKTDGWPTTLMLVNAIGYLAEAAYHHPDLSVTWGRIIVKLQNHAAGGISDKDFELARKIEEVALWKPQGGALEGTPNKWVRPGDPKLAGQRGRGRRSSGFRERRSAGHRSKPPIHPWAGTRAAAPPISDPRPEPICSACPRARRPGASRG